MDVITRKAFADFLSGPTIAFLSQAFRPLFLSAAAFSAVAMAIWLAILAAGTTLPTRFDPLQWHMHEMLFGAEMLARQAAAAISRPCFPGSCSLLFRTGQDGRGYRAGR
ncbi:MAG: NnrS family protein [Acetobacteraceae bacterium]|nr:NnrS family protein [Acetobacteraceae bacterium]MBV8523185.1 NnrS family protein [Acetobacteraceae bacterium]MBV8589229.1 NnrS family protein [Acetobacteraceae bacterium]